MIKLNIEFDKGIVVVAFYKSWLESEIKQVLQKIGENFEDYNIKWVIFDESTLRKREIDNKQYLISPYGNRYGFCYPQKEEIWISTAAIRQRKNNLGYTNRYLTNSFVNQTPERNLLADVIMDELAHIKTQRNHGDPEYDNLLKSYHNMYYKKRLPFVNYPLMNKKQIHRVNPLLRRWLK